MACSAGEGVSLLRKEAQGEQCQPMEPGQGDIDKGCEICSRGKEGNHRDYSTVSGDKHRGNIAIQRCSVDIWCSGLLLRAGQVKTFLVSEAFPF